MVAGIPVALACVLSGCPGDDPVSCTGELRSAVMVVVSSPQSLPVDGVTAEHRFESECRSSPASVSQGAGQGPFAFWCFEQGGGTYVVRVMSGDLTWTRRTHVGADECHTTS